MFDVGLKFDLYIYVGFYVIENLFLKLDYHRVRLQIAMCQVIKFLNISGITRA